MSKAKVIEEKVTVVNGDLKKIIQMAVDAGRKAERKEIQDRIQDNPYYKGVERKLYAYKELKRKLIRDLKDIEDYKKEHNLNTSKGIISTRSKDITSMPIGGEKLDPDEKFKIMLQVKEKSVNETRRQIKEVDDVIEAVSWKDEEKTERDPLVEIIKLKYFENKKPEDIAFIIHCDRATVYRNFPIIFLRVMIQFYGGDVVKSMCENYAIDVQKNV